MHHRSPSRFAALVAIFLPASALAADGPVYRLPPAAIADVLTAPRLPRSTPSVSPDGARVLVPDARAFVPIRVLAEPIERLAGLEVLPGRGLTRDALKQASTGLSIVAIESGDSVRVKLPAEARIAGAAWSPSGKQLALAVLGADALELWVADAVSGAARRLERARLNGVVTRDLVWDGERAIIAALVPAPLPPAVAGSREPAGPAVRSASGTAASQRTARDVLRTSDDQRRFERATLAQLARVPVDGGDVEPIGPAVALADFLVSPDTKHVVVSAFAVPAPTGYPWRLFPRRHELRNARGERVAHLGESPLDTRSAISSVAPLGPRDWRWAPDGKSLWCVEWQDAPNADFMAAVRDTSRPQPGIDRLMRRDAPFTRAAQEALRSELQIENLWFTVNGERILMREGYAPRRIERWGWVASKGGSPRHLVTRSTEGVYDDPGSLLTRPLGQAPLVVTTPDGRAFFRHGDGFRADGQRPFLDRVAFDGARERLWECDAQHLESVQTLLSADGRRFLTRRESNTEPPNLALRRSGESSARLLTHFANPMPALTAAKRMAFTFTRSDSVKLNAEVVLPADWRPGTPLPTLFWIYPNDYRSAAAASQNRRSPNRFPSPSALNPEVLVTQGYAVVYPDLAIVGSNDRYVEELRLSAQAAVDECVRRGFTDRHRIGVGGHSYGAFSTVNALAHTNLFRAGIASDGAYNRTLTPFTFQAEERSFWQARDTYLQMSPFVHADQIDEPLLLLHNQDDTNVGTHPMQSDRMFEALSGLGKRAELVQYPYEDHSPAARETVLDYWARATEWLDRYVKAVPVTGAVSAPMGGDRP